MAALPIGHSVLNTTNTTSSKQELVRSRSRARFLVLLACQSHKPVDTSTPQTRKENKQNKGNKKLFAQILFGVEKFGKGLKENLSPQQKGDWKDLVLMSLSFAVYVYISEQIVCAYMGWMSVPQQSW